MGSTERTGETNRNGLTRLLRCKRWKSYWDWVERVTITERFPLSVTNERWTAFRKDQKKIRLAVKVLLWGEGFNETLRTVVATQDFVNSVRDWLIQWGHDGDFQDEIAQIEPDLWTPRGVEAAIHLLDERHRRKQLVLAAKKHCKAMEALEVNVIGNMEQQQ